MLQTKAELITAKTNDLLTGAVQHYLRRKIYAELLIYKY